MDYFTEAKKLFLHKRLPYSVYKESALPNQVTEKAIIYSNYISRDDEIQGKNYALTGVVTSQETAAEKNATVPRFAG